MDKFCHSAGEIEVAATQCDLCIFQINGSKEICQKFADKPKEILLNERKCPYVRNSKLMDLGD